MITNTNVVVLRHRTPGASQDSQPRKRRDDTAGILRACGSCAAAVGAAKVAHQVDPDNAAAVTAQLDLARHYLHLLRRKPATTRLESLDAKGRLIEAIFAADSVVEMSPELRRFMITTVRDVRAFIAMMGAAQ